MEFKLIRPDKNSFITVEFQIIEVILITLITVTLGRWTETHYIIISLIAISLFIISKLYTRRLYPDWVRKKDIIGRVRFADREIITSNGTIFHLDNYNFLHIKHNYVKGLQLGYLGTQNNGVAKLILTDSSGTKESIQFLIESKEHQKTFTTALKNYYKSGLKIKEEFGEREIKTILLSPDTKYTDKELEDLRKELQIDSFYK